MRHNDLNDLNRRLREEDYENVFPVQTDTDGRYYYNLLQNLSIVGDIDPRLFFEHRYNGENWFFLSNQYYSTVDLYWIILKANKIKNPFDFPENGTILRIPTPTFVRNVLTVINNRNLQVADG